MNPASHALELAHEAGFDLAGIAPLAPPPAAAHFERWLAAGRHADMEYLERFRERILDPRKIRAEGRSLLVIGHAHARAPVELAQGGRIARYAASRDYHNVIGKALRKLGQRLAAEGFGEHWRKIVDAGPLLERSHAAVAGLGFESKAANLLSPEFGPWFFLGELILEADLEPTPGPAPGTCGTCTLCIDACPTQAIVAPGTVHAPLCLSYQTIENRGHIPDEVAAQLGEWLFGCDVCSEVCPHGEAAEDVSKRNGTHAAVREAQERGGPFAWLEADPEAFSESLSGSPLKRTGARGLARNAAHYLGNHPSERGLELLARVLAEHPEAVVRSAAAWALARGHSDDRGVREALERAVQREADPESAQRIAAQRARL